MKLPILVASLLLSSSLALASEDNGPYGAYQSVSPQADNYKVPEVPEAKVIKDEKAVETAPIVTEKEHKAGEAATDHKAGGSHKAGGYHYGHGYGYHKGYGFGYWSNGRFYHSRHR